MKKGSFESVVFERHIDKINSAIEEINEQLETIKECGIEFCGEMIIKNIFGDILRVNICEESTVSFSTKLKSVIKRIYQEE